MRRSSRKISPRVPGAHDFLEACIVQGVGEPREHLQMAAHGRTDKRKEHVHRLAIQSPEVNWLFQETECDHRVSDIQDDRVAHVRQSDAITDGRSCGSLSGQEKTQNQLVVDARRKRQHTNQGRKALSLLVSLRP